MASNAFSISEVIDRAPVGRFQKRTIMICAGLAFVEGFGVQSAGFVAPVLGKVFHLDHHELGLFFSLGLLGMMLGALLLGPLADRIGRKPVLFASAVLFGLCSLGQALAPSLVILCVFRFFNLFGIGGAMPNAIAMTSEYAPARRRSLMVVLMFSGFSVGSVAAGLAAARLLEAFGWQSVFALGGLLPLLLAAIVLLALPESVRFLAARGDAQARVAALMRRIDPTLGANARFVLDTDADHRISVAALFSERRGRRTLVLWIVSFCSLLDLFLMTNWLPTQIASLGVPIGIAILMGTLLQVGGLIGIGLGWIMDRAGPVKTLVTAYAIGAVSIACIAVAGNNLVFLGFSVLAAGFGMLGGQTATNAVAALSYPTQIRGTGIGWYFGVGRFGSVIGPTLAGFLLSAGVSNQSVFLLAAIPAMIAAIASIGLKPQTHARTDLIESSSDPLRL